MVTDVSHMSCRKTCLVLDLGQSMIATVTSTVTEKGDLVAGFSLQDRKPEVGPQPGRLLCFSYMLVCPRWVRAGWGQLEMCSDHFLGHDL